MQILILSDYKEALRGTIEKVKKNKSKDCWRNINCDRAVESFNAEMEVRNEGVLCRHRCRIGKY